MPKYEKVKVNVKERVEDNICDLSLSELNEVPVKEIVAFKRVTILDLSSNKLQSLGKQFCTLTRLVKLDLSKNEIKYLPDDFGLLRNLRHLDLYDNKLEHLPLSFGELTNLRYLDLKDNPLTPALAKIVGFCLTTKECQDSARNTVKFLAQMQIEACKAKQEFRDQLQKLISNGDAEQQNQQSNNTQSLEIQQQQQQIQKQAKKSNKKTKSKQKRSNNNNNEDTLTVTTNVLNSNGAGTKNKTSNTSNNNNKPNKTKKSSSSSSTSTSTSTTTNGGILRKPKTNSMAALTTIFTFLLLLAINIVIIYMIMFKNPEIADKLVEIIPHQYRDWILTKTEIFRLRVTDWISEFRTPPEEN